LFAPEARWGSCVGGDEIVGWMQRAVADGVEATVVELDARTDRVVLGLDLHSETADRRLYQTAFVADGRIIELQDATDRDAALRATASAPPPSPRGPRSGLATAAAIFPVRDLGAALEHYRQLGFTVRAYEGGGYGFVERGPVELHLAEIADIDPGTNVCAVYLFVDDADALHAEWSAAAVVGRLVEPVETDYGLREGAHVDPDGNLIRFGSPLDD
jgi:hypothetical protein